MKQGIAETGKRQSRLCFSMERKGRKMIFETFGEKSNPAILFFHAMGVTGASSKPIVNYLKEHYFCILPTSTVYCRGQKYKSKEDEVRQVERFLHQQGITELAFLHW